MEPKERRCQSAKVQLEILFKFLNQSPRELSRHEESAGESESGDYENDDLRDLDGLPSG
ncbi:hypothetical protein F2Q70_00010531 [Brassica cretica]|uniref:Uncharacterized protein n=1 Tax=Brassica cretica TaxID=69181 RepID=A0A3N6RHA7_BRACR|nr:hypothetical protein F2Q70_00010531 [Brassica cretica]KAF3551499.1 hypothetical protein DY000_02005267 [Brassica cretica]